MLIELRKGKRCNFKFVPVFLLLILLFGTSQTNADYNSSEVDENILAIWDSGYYDYGREIFEYNGSLYVIGFSDGSPDENWERIELLKYSQEGVLAWNLSWNADYFFNQYGIIAHESSLYVTGNIDVPYSAESNLLLVKMSEDGEVFWEKTYSEPDLGNDMCLCNESLFIASSGWNYFTGSNDMKLIKMDLNGTILWNIQWGLENLWADYGRRLICDEELTYVSGNVNSYAA